MTEQEELNDLLVVILANANVARKAIFVVNGRIKIAIEESSFNERELATFMRFIDLFMHGTDREEIFRKLGVLPETQERLTHLPLNW